MSFSIFSSTTTYSLQRALHALTRRVHRLCTLNRRRRVPSSGPFLKQGVSSPSNPRQKGGVSANPIPSRLGVSSPPLLITSCPENLITKPFPPPFPHPFPSHYCSFSFSLSSYFSFFYPPILNPIHSLSSPFDPPTPSLASPFLPFLLFFFLSSSVCSYPSLTFLPPLSYSLSLFILIRLYSSLFVFIHPPSLPRTPFPYISLLFTLLSTKYFSI